MIIMLTKEQMSMRKFHLIKIKVRKHTIIPTRSVDLSLTDLFLGNILWNGWRKSGNPSRTSLDNLIQPYYPYFPVHLSRCHQEKNCIDFEVEVQEDRQLEDTRFERCYSRSSTYICFLLTLKGNRTD